MADQFDHQLLPNVPPPPPEVRVRTLRSDLESMAKSGGASPQFQNVKAPSLANLSGGGGGRVEAKKPSVSFATALTVLVAVVLVLAIVYFVYEIMISPRRF